MTPTFCEPALLGKRSLCHLRDDHDDFCDDSDNVEEYSESTYISTIDDLSLLDHELFNTFNRMKKKLKQVHTVCIKIQGNSNVTSSITCSFPFYSAQTNQSFLFDSKPTLISNASHSSVQSTNRSPSSSPPYINIRSLTGQTMRVYSYENLTLSQVKMAVSDSFQIPFEKQQVVFRGRILNDDSLSMQTYGLHSNDSLFVVLDVFHNRQVMDATKIVTDTCFFTGYGDDNYQQDSSDSLDESDD